MDALIAEYAEYLDSLVNKEQNIVFLNSSAKHASMVMSRIFKHSDTEVLIMAGNLNGDVCLDSEYIFELSNFLLTKKGQLKILLREFNPNNPPEIFNLLQMFPEQVRIKKANSDFLNESLNPVHFTVGSKMDDENRSKAVMYRLEHDIKHYLAKGNFNDPIAASEYYNQFYKVFDSPESIEIALN